MAKQAVNQKKAATGPKAPAKTTNQKKAEPETPKGLAEEAFFHLDEAAVALAKMSKLLIAQSQSNSRVTAAQRFINDIKRSLNGYLQ